MLFRSPGMTVLTPKDGNQLQAMMDYALHLDGPCAIRYPRGDADYNNNILSTYSGGNLRIAEMGSGRSAIDIWAVGAMYACGEKVCSLLRDRGYDAGLVDVTTVKPLDLSLLSKDCHLLVTLEDNVLEGGFGQQAAAVLASASANDEKKRFFSRREEGTKVLRFGWPDSFIEHGSVAELREKYGLTPEKITERICEQIEGKA